MDFLVPSLIISGVIVLAWWHFRNPETKEESEDLDNDSRNW